MWKKAKFLIWKCTTVTKMSFLKGRVIITDSASLNGLSSDHTTLIHIQQIIYPCLSMLMFTVKYTYYQMTYQRICTIQLDEVQSIVSGGHILDWISWREMVVLQKSPQRHDFKSCCRPAVSKSGTPKNLHAWAPSEWGVTCFMMALIAKACQCLQPMPEPR